MKTIYTNGVIISLEDYSGNALVEENGKIINIGNYQELYEKGMKVVDLEGHTLIPAFIDSHSPVSYTHLTYSILLYGNSRFCTTR